MKPHQVHKVIEQDLAPLLAGLAELGYVPIGNDYSPGAFGNYYLDFSGGPHGTLRIVLDRSQYTIENDRAALESVGLWRAFADRDEFCSKVLAWLRGGGRQSL
jgi:hypothetical protein